MSELESRDVPRRLISRLNWLIPYGMGLAAVALAYGLALVGRSLVPLPEELLFILVVILATGLGGIGPGLAATAFSIVPMVMLSDSWGTGDAAAWGLFAAAATGITWIGGRLFYARQANEETLSDLRDRQAHLESILDAIPDAVIVTDEHGTIRSFSSAAERLFGHDPSEAVGRSINNLMPEPYSSAHAGYMRRYRETGEAHIIGIGRLVIGLRNDGSTFPMELAIAEIRSGGKRLFIGFVRDVTERQQTEARLQELQSELVYMSRVTAMGEIASALAHELNQPLSAIANYLKGVQRLLERKGDDSLKPVSVALDKASEQALRAGEIIRKIRGFIGRSETERKVQSVAKLVEEAAALALVGAKDLRIRVRFHIDPTIDKVMADRIQIQQVLINLIRNAIEAMSESDVRELVITNAVHADGKIRVEVSDTGSGLTPTVAPHLFQPFVTSKPDGMGVGLSISKAIIEAHDGEIWAQANEGGGTRFSLTLPAASREDIDAG